VRTAVASSFSGFRIPPGPDGTDALPALGLAGVPGHRPHQLRPRRANDDHRRRPLPWPCPEPVFRRPSARALPLRRRLHR
jgi:hypothetical protein